MIHEYYPKSINQNMSKFNKLDKLIHLMFLRFLIFLLLLFPKSTYATGEFAITQNIDYYLDSAGNATVKQEVTLTNNYSEIYPKDYQLKLLGSNIENIQGTDNVGNIVQKSEKQNEETTIFLKFNQANVGRGQSTKFNLNYQLPNLATHKGKIWEVPLPEYKPTNETEQINIKLFVPSNFGHLSFSSVKADNITNFNDQTQIQLNNQTIKNKKILLTFGNYQVFDFELKYFIGNQSAKTITSEIALPPQTESQKIIYQEIIPPPQNVRVDSDGNWLAQYQLAPQQNLEILASGQAKIISSINQNHTSDLSVLTQSQTFWPTTDSNILQIASNLKSPKDIYNYVINTLDYDYNSVNSSIRKGALEALLSPQNSICTEFTDLFITLARAKGIPAREINGFAYSNNPKIKPINVNTDIIHAWPEYYDSTKQTWIPIDPTWGETTNGIDYFNDLDLNHFIFVIHGTDSQKPLPPGAYKNNQNIKTVLVDFAEKELSETFLPPKINQNLTVNLQNPNSNALSDLIINIPSQKWQKKIDILPPYSNYQIDIPKNNFFRMLFSRKINITVQFNNTSASYSIKNPFHWTKYVIIRK